MANLSHYSIEQLIEELETRGFRTKLERVNKILPATKDRILKQTRSIDGTVIKKGNHFTEAGINMIFADFAKNDLTAYQIAKQYNVSPTSIYALYRKWQTTQETIIKK